MKNNSLIAHIRRLMVIHSAGLLAIFWILHAIFPVRPDAKYPAWYLWILVLGPGAWALLNLSRMYWYARRVRGVRVNVIQDFFLYGLPVSQLKKLYGSQLDFREGALKYLELFPEVGEEVKKEFMALNESNQFTKALSVLNKAQVNARKAVRTAQHEAQDETRRADREHRRQMRRSGEYASLHALGAAIDIPEGELRDALSLGISQTKRLIERAQRRQDILRLARSYGFEGLVERILGDDNIDYAQELLTSAVKISQRASQCNAVDEVQQHLRLGQLAEAESIVKAAENLAAGEREKSALLSRLRGKNVPMSLRLELEPKIHALDADEYGTRQYRMDVHRIKSQLER